MIMGNKKGFQSLEPERLAAYFKKKEKEIQAVIPKIKEISSTKLENDNISLSRGLFSLRKALFDLLNQNETINIYSIPSKVLGSFGEAFCNMKDFHKERMKRKVRIRHIYSQDSPEMIDGICKLKDCEVKHLTKKFDHLTTTLVCGNSVINIIFSEPMAVIEVKNKKIAESYHKHFDVLWESATLKKQRR